MAERSAPDTPATEEKSSLAEHLPPKDLDEVVEVLDYFENCGAYAADVAIRNPKSCEEDCLIIAADAKIERAKKL